MSMPTLWAKDDPTVNLALGDVFEVAYPQNYLPHVTDLRKSQMTRDEINEVTVNLFEHPTLDLRSIFQDFRLAAILPEKDALSVQTFLGECQEDIKLLDVKIKSTISTIAQLSRDLTRVSARMVQKVSQVRLCEYLLSPLEHLPQDVLEQIFLACLATNDDPAPDPTYAPLQLAAVCHRWRTIALSMPSLWNNLYITSDKGVELTKTWATRCYLPSLTLRFDNDNNIASSKFDEVVDVLQGPSRSLRKLDVIGLGGRLGDSMRKFIMERDHPDLEELVLRDYNEELDSLPPASSSLLHFYTHMIPKAWHSSPPPSQLTVLWITTKIHSNTLVIFLATCPHLESLYVDICEAGLRLEPEPQVSKDITLHRLSYLGIWDSYEDGEPPEDLLRGMSFPSLRVVEYCVSKRSQDESTLWNGFVHALNSVRRLTVQFHDALPSLDTFTRLLEHAASITELSISTNSRHISEIITSLTSMASGSADQSTKLPCLQTLYLDIAFGSLTGWFDFEPQLAKLSSAWTTTQSSEPNGTHSLTNLVIQHRHSGYVETEDRNKEWECPKVMEVLQTACPNLRVRLVSVQSTSWLGDVPVSFGMFPPPFNGIPVYGVMQDDGNWTDRVGAVYQVM